MTMKVITVAPTIKYGFEASKLVVVLHDQQLLQLLPPKPPPPLKNYYGLHDLDLLRFFSSPKIR